MVVQLRDRRRPVPVCGAETVRAGVAAADDHHVLVPCRDRRRSVAFAFPVGGDQVVHREVDPVEAASLDRGVVTRAQRPDREDHRVEVGAQPIDRQVDADLAGGHETGSFALHLPHTAVDRRLVHLERGDAVAQQAAEPIVAFEHRDGVTGTGELLGRGQSRRPRADDGHRVTGSARRLLGGDGAALPCRVRDGLLDPLDGDRPAGIVLGDRQHARGLARRRTEAPGELREVVRRMQSLAGLVPQTDADEVVPFRYQVAERTARGHAVAERDRAIHAPPCLHRDVPVPLHRLFVRVDLIPVQRPRRDRALRRLLAGHIEEPPGIRHTPAPWSS